MKPELINNVKGDKNMERIINLVKEFKDILAIVLFVIIAAISVAFIKYNITVSVMLWLISSALMMGCDITE